MYYDLTEKEKNTQHYITTNPNPLALLGNFKVLFVSSYISGKVFSLFYFIFQFSILYLFHLFPVVHLP